MKKIIPSLMVVGLVAVMGGAVGCNTNRQPSCFQPVVVIPPAPTPAPQVVTNNHWRVSGYSGKGTYSNSALVYTNIVTVTNTVMTTNGVMATFDTVTNLFTVPDGKEETQYWDVGGFGTPPAGYVLPGVAPAPMPAPQPVAQAPVQNPVVLVVEQDDETTLPHWQTQFGGPVVQPGYGNTYYLSRGGHRGHLNRLPTYQRLPPPTSLVP